MTAIVPLSTLVEQAREFRAAARSERTRTEYKKQWTAFRVWCDGHGLAALPALPATLACYMTARAGAGLKPASLKVAIAAIAAEHKSAGLASPHKHPQVAEIWQGIRRQLGTAARTVDPVVTDDLRAVLAMLPRSLAGARDRALLTLGFAGAFRRSELAELRVEDLNFTEDELIVTLARSKTDQTAKGVSTGIPRGSREDTCPVRSLRAWLAAADITEGRVFRYVDRHGCVHASLGAGSVADIIKEHVEAAGLDPARFSGHSLRSGFATSAYLAGKGEHAIMVQGRWRSRATLDRYIRDADLLSKRNAARGLL